MSGTFTPNSDEDQQGKWLYTFLPKLQLINIQFNTTSNVLQPPVGVYLMKVTLLLPAQAQADLVKETVGRIRTLLLQKAVLLPQELWIREGRKTALNYLCSHL